MTKAQLTKFYPIRSDLHRFTGDESREREKQSLNCSTYGAKSFIEVAPATENLIWRSITVPWPSCATRSEKKFTQSMVSDVVSYSHDDDSHDASKVTLIKGLHSI